MTPRRIFFWIHLTAGCVAGLVILVMSVTGVLLAYRRQIMRWSDRQLPPQAGRGHAASASGSNCSQVYSRHRDEHPPAITVRSSSAAPVAFDFGRERTVFVDPYTGQILGEESRKLRAFFSAVEDWHRWLGAGGDKPAYRARGDRSLQPRLPYSGDDWSVLVVAERMELEKPEKDRAVSRRSMGSRARLELAQRAGILVRGAVIPDCDHGRDHVVCVGQQSALSHDGECASASSLAYSSGPSGTRSRAGAAEKSRPWCPGSETARFGELDKLFARAGLEVPGWTTITLRLPNAAAGPLTFSIDRGNGGRPDLRSQLTLDPVSGEIVRWESFSSYNRGRQLRAWARFTHTGEAGGLAWPNPRGCRFRPAPRCWCLPASRLGCGGSWPGRSGGRRQSIDIP